MNEAQRDTGRAVESVSYPAGDENGTPNLALVSPVSRAGAGGR
jgi:hypothetical protein